jgi:uncharacterized protein (DUF1330 family)
MTTYLINHLRIPNGIPKAESLDHLERVEATFKPYGGRWLAIDAPVEVREGAWRRGTSGPPSPPVPEAAP